MKTLKLSDIQERLRELTIPPPTPEKAVNSSGYFSNPFVVAAAVLVTYSPSTLLPSMVLPVAVTDDRVELINELIGCSELVYTEPAANEDFQNGVRYMLKDDVRKEALQYIVNGDLIADTLKANPIEANLPGSPLQHILTAALSGKLRPIGEMMLSDLTALQRVSEWLEKTSLSLPTQNQIRQKIATMELLSNFRHLTGRYEGDRFVEYFRGRESELSTLRKYAGVASTQGFLESIQRGFENYVEPILNWENKPPLLIYGMGGVGKSTLLAKFLLDHAEAYESERFPFVYLDFDRPVLDAYQPESLLVESARQLSVQYSEDPMAFSIFSNFYNYWKDRKVSAATDNDTRSVSFSGTTLTTTIRENRFEILDNFAGALKDFSKISRRPFLMVIDTFEEVQFRGPDCVEDLYEYLYELQRIYPTLRLVVSGRSPVSNLKVQLLELKELDVQAATGYLNKYGITDKRTVKNIITTVGGNPLSLKLAIELVRDFGEDELKNIKVTGDNYIFFKKRFPDMEVQGILYKRILGHIRNPLVRKLAHPGLVLRLLSADVIWHVLSEPCQLKITSAAEAEDLFREIQKEVSLITPVDNLTVRHRPDIRKVMLGLIMQKEPKLVKTIHREAILYYEHRTDIPSRAEELYHRLCLNQAHELLNERWLPGVEHYLRNIIDELPSRSQAYIAGRTDIPVEENVVWDIENFELSKNRIIRNAVNLLNSGRADKVLNRFGKILDNVDKSGIMNLITVKAQLQLFQTDDAYKTIEQTLNILGQDRLDSKITDELLKLKDEIDNGWHEKKDDRNSASDSEFHYDLQ